ncbi:MAG TPA: hypothetical protein VJO35_17620 [Terriglobales bacterium]|nr:hypothetical protein [Terriglobales bacterium]
MARKKSAVKQVKNENVYADKQWTVHFGKLNPGPGRPQKNLFLVVGEKLPFESINKVNAYLRARDIRRVGVYVAQDSMGYARYIGRGKVFSRLRSHLEAHKLELKYFSFCIVEDRGHEREIETLLIHATGPLLQFNTNKKRLTISPGNIRDYEAGTLFFERHYKQGKNARMS